MKQYLDLVYQQAWRFARTIGIDVDDCAGYGVIGFLQAVKNFDAGRGAELSTFATRCIASAIRQGMRKWGARLLPGTRDGRRIHFSSETVRCIENSCRQPNLSATRRKIQLLLFLDDAMAAISPEEQQLLRWRADGHSWPEIGKRIGRSRELARRRTKAVVRKARVFYDTIDFR